MEMFQAHWDQLQDLLLRKSLQKCIPLWGSETSFFGTVVKFLVRWKYWKKKKQVDQRLLEILHSLDCHREEECRVKGEVTAVSCWQLCFTMKFLLFVSWPRPSLAKQLILTKWHYSNIFLQKLKSLISFFDEEVLKCEIHIKVVVSNVCRILGSSLMKYSRSIGITHHCLLGFIIQEIQGKVGMLCFFSRYMLGLSWLWLTMYFQYRAFFPPKESGLGNIQPENLILCWLFFPL